MVDLSRRLQQLEQEQLPQGSPPVEEGEVVRRQRWLRRASVRRRFENRSQAETHVRGLIRALLPRGEFDGMNLEQLRERLRAWQPPLEEAAVDHVTAQLAYHQEPPLGPLNVVPCPERWAEAFRAREQLRELYGAIPPGVIARSVVGSEDLEPYGITPDLERLAVGPDASEIDAEEQLRRIREALPDLFYGEQGYEVEQHVIELSEDKRS